MIARRGDGIGLEITSTVIRGVRLAHDEPGRVAAVCEVPIGRFEDNAVVFDAFVRARGRLGADALTTRVAWFPSGSTMQRVDVTGKTGPELNSLRHSLADEMGITSTMLIDAEARRWMLALRWDHNRAWWLQELLERAGFADVTVEPAPVALGRALGRDITVARRDASAERSWAVLYDGVPIAATTIESGTREHPGIACASSTIGVHDLHEVLSESAVSQEVARLVAEAVGGIERTSELDAHLVVLDEPYPPFPAHDLRAPQRVGVALGAGIGAAGLAGRLRAVDVLTSVRQTTAEVLPRPWAVERLADAPLEIERERPSFWSRTGKLVRSWFRRSPKKV
ncbi:MAG: hypothetical protein WBP59_11015 [Ilumatobacteraceae bacterium]